MLHAKNVDLTIFEARGPSNMAWRFGTVAVRDAFSMQHTALMSLPRVHEAHAQAVSNAAWQPFSLWVNEVSALDTGGPNLAASTPSWNAQEPSNTIQQSFLAQRVQARLTDSTALSYARPTLLM